MLPPVDAQTRLAALLGYPVAHSLSPLIHNTAFRSLGLNYRYLAFSVSPADLETAVSGLRALGFWGANITLPHKQSVFSLLDHHTEAASAVGAVNTLFWQDAEHTCLAGHNTDIEGFLAPLEPFRSRLKGKPALVLGAGGASRAVIYALLKDIKCASVAVIARNRQKASALAEIFREGHSVTAMSFGELQAEQVTDAHLIVNATPVGMHPSRDAVPLAEIDALHAGHVVYDLVYNPTKTLLLEEAAYRGAVVIGGLEMLIRQAAGSFQLWTGRPMPVKEVEAVIHRKLSND